MTPRARSQRVGIALGLTKVLLRNFVQKGYRRATQASWKRWLYSLTPEGFTHKIRLTAAYIDRVLSHYQNVRRTLRKQLEPLALHEESRVAIFGTGELAELVYLGLKELSIEEIDVFDFQPQARRFLGMPVRAIESLQNQDYDRVVIAYLEPSKSMISGLRRLGVSSEQLVNFFSDGKSKEGLRWG